MFLRRKIKAPFVSCKYRIITLLTFLAAFFSGITYHSCQDIKQIEEHSYHGEAVLGSEKIMVDITFDNDKNMAYIKLTTNNAPDEKIVYAKIELTSLLGRSLVNAVIRNKTNAGYSSSQEELVSATLMWNASKLIFIFNLKDFDIESNAGIDNAVMILYKDK